MVAAVFHMTFKTVILSLKGGRLRMQQGISISTLWRGTAGDATSLVLASWISQALRNLMHLKVRSLFESSAARHLTLMHGKPPVQHSRCRRLEKRSNL